MMMLKMMMLKMMMLMMMMMMMDGHGSFPFSFVNTLQFTAASIKLFNDKLSLWEDDINVHLKSIHETSANIPSVVTFSRHRVCQKKKKKSVPVVVGVVVVVVVDDDDDDISVSVIVAAAVLCMIVIAYL
jgi:hypothetical protein